MTNQAKSLRKGKFKPSRAPVAKASRAKGRRGKGKPPRRDPLDSFVDAAAHALDLKLEPAWENAVQTNLQGTLALAGPFSDFPLPDGAEPGPVFSAWGAPVMDTAWAHASESAAAVCDGRASAAAVVRAALARIAKHDRGLNAFTAVTAERALAKAAAIDAERA